MRPQGAEEVLEGSPTQWGFQHEEKIAVSAMKLRFSKRNQGRYRDVLSDSHNPIVTIGSYQVPQPNSGYQKV